MRNFCTQLKTNPKYFQIHHWIVEAPFLYLAKDYYQNYNTEYEQGYILHSLGINKKQIDLLFNDYFKHCFPSTSMCFESFADYLSKYGFRENNTKMRRLFNALKQIKSYEPYCTWPHL